MDFPSDTFGYFLQDVPLKHEYALKPFPIKVKATGSVKARTEPGFERCLHLGEDVYVILSEPRIWRTLERE